MRKRKVWVQDLKGTHEKSHTTAKKHVHMCGLRLPTFQPHGDLATYAYHLSTLYRHSKLHDGDGRKNRTGA